MQFQQVVKLWLLFMVNLSLVLLYAECEKSRTRVQIRDPDIVLHVQVSSHCCYMQLVQQGVKLWPVVCLTMVRDAFVSKKCSFFEHCSKGL